MKIESGKRYVMRYGGITAPMNRNGDNTHGYYWTDGYEFWCKNGLWNLEEDRRDIISEYIPQPEPLTFELKAGERYETVKPDGTAGPVVELREGTIGKGVESVNAMFPFNADFDNDNGRPHYLTPAGEIYHHREGKPCLRIVRPYVEPKPPTPIERLEQWRDEWTGKTYAMKDADLRAIIADLKATVKP